MNIRVYSFTARNPRARKAGGKPGPLVWRAKVEQEPGKWAEGTSASLALAQLRNTFPETGSYTVEVEE